MIKAFKETTESNEVVNGVNIVELTKDLLFQQKQKDLLMKQQQMEQLSDNRTLLKKINYFYCYPTALKEILDNGVESNSLSNGDQMNI